MKAIVTRYLPPIGDIGARISARVTGSKATINYPYELSDRYEAHLKAAKKLCEKMQWTEELIGGDLPSGEGYAFIRVIPVPF